MVLVSGGSSRGKKEKAEVLFFEEVGREERESHVTWVTHSN